MFLPFLMSEGALTCVSSLIFSPFIETAPLSISLRASPLLLATPVPTNASISDVPEVAVGISEANIFSSSSLKPWTGVPPNKTDVTFSTLSVRSEPCTIFVTSRASVFWASRSPGFVATCSAIASIDCLSRSVYTLA